jgi:hypothetical protein
MNVESRNQASGGNLPRSPTNTMTVLDGPCLRLEKVDRVSREEKVGRQDNARAAQARSRRP